MQTYMFAPNCKSMRCDARAIGRARALITHIAPYKTWYMAWHLDRSIKASAVQLEKNVTAKNADCPPEGV